MTLVSLIVISDPLYVIFVHLPKNPRVLFFYHLGIKSNHSFLRTWCYCLLAIWMGCDKTSKFRRVSQVSGYSERIIDLGLKKNYKDIRINESIWPHKRFLHIVILLLLVVQNIWVLIYIIDITFTLNAYSPVHKPIYDLDWVPYYYPIIL